MTEHDFRALARGGAFPGETDTQRSRLMPLWPAIAILVVMYGVVGAVAAVLRW